MIAIRTALRALAADDCGATAMEYGLIVACIAISISGALSLLGGGTDGMWTTLSSVLGGALSTS